MYGHGHHHEKETKIASEKLSLLQKKEKNDNEKG